MAFFKRYILNFWIWWYLVRAREVIAYCAGVWNFTLGYFNIVPMLSNLFVPLYQDYTKTGIVVSIPIRLTWVVVGIFLQIIVTIPLVAIVIIFLVFPVMPVLAVIEYLINT